MERILVGVDGSKTAQQALDWALDEARVRHAAVEVMHAWHAPFVEGFPITANPGLRAQHEEAARKVLQAAVAGADTTGLDAPVESVLIEGSPPVALLKAAEQADLLVVGSRGLGGFSGLMLGSVSHQVVHHAPCPVVVVPAVD